MRKAFEKHETLGCILLIAAYVAVNSYCMQNFGPADHRSAVINTVFSALLIALTAALGRTEYYGLKKGKGAKKYLYFLPLVVIGSVNLWGGIHIQNSAGQIVFHILTMINVGFLEEVIFRGFLFRMMEKDDVKTATAVSAVTFGMGHIVNLLNGAELVPTLMQLCYAAAIGYLFVIIFCKSKSLVPCIITHAAINALSVFHGESAAPVYLVPAVLTAVSLSYAVYIQKTVKE